MVHWGSEDCVPPLPTDDVDAAWRWHLIDCAPAVGLSSVTEDNADEWYWRIKYLMRSEPGRTGPGRMAWPDASGKVTQRHITLAILRRWVGLWTNWSKYTRAKWVKAQQAGLIAWCDKELAAAAKNEEVSNAND
jgi:hypothetical protein